MGMDSGDGSLKPVPADLEELAEVLEGDPMAGGGILNLDTGEVIPECAIDYMRDDEGIDLYETIENQLSVDRLGSHEAYQDMVDYIATVADEHLADLLTVAVTGRGAFRRFTDVLADRTGTLEPYHAFAHARKYQRAAAWLAERGYVSTHTRSTRLT